MLDIKPYIPAYDTVERRIEDLAEEVEVDEGEAEVEKTLEENGKNSQRADELLQRLQAGEEGIKVYKIIRDQIKLDLISELSLMLGEASWRSRTQGESA